jgi:hypothetical protein
MRNVFRLVSIALLAALPMAASAIIVIPCFYAGEARFLPEVRGPNDPIGYKVVVPPSSSAIGYPQYKYILIRESLVGADTFAVDVVLTDDPNTFPDYRPVNFLDQNWGFIGPLSPGSYTILATISVYDPGSGMLRPWCDPMRFGPRKTPLQVFAADDPWYQGAAFKPVAVPVIEYYDAALDHYFMTANANEIVALDANRFPGWLRTGQMFFGYDRGLSGVSRYYGLPSAGLDSHFFTLDVAENQFVRTVLSWAWIVEEDGAFVIWQPLTATGFCPTNTLPVYRLWNERMDSNHRYTIDPAVRQDMIAKGWIPEGYGPDGVVMCAPAL